MDRPAELTALTRVNTATVATTRMARPKASQRAKIIGAFAVSTVIGVSVGAVILNSRAPSAREARPAVADAAKTVEEPRSIAVSPTTPSPSAAQTASTSPIGAVETSPTTTAAVSAQPSAPRSTPTASPSVRRPTKRSKSGLPDDI
jgi:hypothetical protein